MQRLTQAEMRYLKRNYRDYDVMIDIINGTADSCLYRIFDKCMYSHECVQLNESEFPLMEVCDNVIERNYGWYDERPIISKQFSDSLMSLFQF